MAGPDRELLLAVLAAHRRLDPPGCFAAVADGGLRLLGGRWALGYQASPSGDELLSVAARGEEGAGELGTVLGVLDPGLMRRFSPGGATILRDAGSLVPPGEERRLPALGEALLVPLRSGAGTVGLLLLLRGKGERFAAGAPRRAAEYARLLEPVFDNLRAVASLRELVIRDDTADCYNRRYLDQSLDDEVARARRFGGRFSVIFVDMDNLKDVNTRHGHASGSRVLYEASVRIGRSIRSIDRLFRYGGDEFVVLLPGTGREGAREVAERIRRAIAREPFPLPTGARVPLTVSAGVATWPDHGGSPRDVVDAADAALRRVKERGKNAVAEAGTGEESVP